MHPSIDLTTTSMKSSPFSPRPMNRSNRSGMTLVEIVIVMIILSAFLYVPVELLVQSGKASLTAVQKQEIGSKLRPMHGYFSRDVRSCDYALLYTAPKTGLSPDDRLETDQSGNFVALVRTRLVVQSARTDTINPMLIGIASAGIAEPEITSITFYYCEPDANGGGGTVYRKTVEFDPHLKDDDVTAPETVFPTKSEMRLSHAILNFTDDPGDSGVFSLTDNGSVRVSVTVARDHVMRNTSETFQFVSAPQR